MALLLDEFGYRLITYGARNATLAMSK